LHQHDEEPEDPRFTIQAGLAQGRESRTPPRLVISKSQLRFCRGGVHSPGRCIDAIFPFAAFFPTRSPRKTNSRRPAEGWVFSPCRTARLASIEFAAAFNVHLAATRSCSSNRSFREIPHLYPAKFPSCRTTRWQGTTIDTGFVAHARATARTAFGFPTASATCEYVFVVPDGIRCSSCHTRR